MGPLAPMSSPILKAQAHGLLWTAPASFPALVSVLETESTPHAAPDLVNVPAPSHYAQALLWSAPPRDQNPTFKVTTEVVN